MLTNALRSNGQCSHGMSSVKGEKESNGTLSTSKTRCYSWKLKRKGAILDAEAEAFLADVECTAPYDEPLAITIQMLLKAQVNVNEVPTPCINTIFDNVESSDGHMRCTRSTEALKLDVDSDMMDNTIPVFIICTKWTRS
ncbi:hypothetical protein Tco_1132573 [Tanacetum coccineum]|uniref:Uncharacterized protein n=1 Tax=Tanacetum coccineum TaxID=301880 RepID=A0ABQ5JCA8_9ASTR